MVSLYSLNITLFVRALTNLSAVLKKGEEYAKANNIDPATLIEARLYEDMGNLAFQIQRCSDSSKLAAVRIAGVETVSMADTETTFEQLYERIQKTIDFLNAVDEKAYEGKESVDVTFKLGPNNVTYNGEDYMIKFCIPNFFFHVTTAYDILRNKGIPVGKKDFLHAGFV